MERSLNRSAEKAGVTAKENKTVKENKGGNDKIDKKDKKDKKPGTSFEEIRKKFPKAYMPWEKEEDEKLIKLFEKNIKIKDLAKEFGRKRGAITARLEKLGLIEK